MSNTKMVSVQSSQFSQQELEIIRQTVASKTTPQQFALFVQVCKYSGLNPFMRQIYAVVRGNDMTIQTGIDGYRILAERSGKYAGQIGPQWCGEDGEWKDVWLKKEPPAAARIGVLRRDFREPIWGVAKYSSYEQSTSPLWRKMPEVMLAKCAESLALRKAFPAEMAGIYTHEEMEQAGNELLSTADAHQASNVVDASESRQDDRSHVVEVQASNHTADDTQDATVPAQPQMATLQQMTSIEKLRRHLGKTGDVGDLDYQAAGRMITELTREYRETKQKAS